MTLPSRTKAARLDVGSGVGDQQTRRGIEAFMTISDESNPEPGEEDFARVSRPRRAAPADAETARERELRARLGELEAKRRDAERRIAGNQNQLFVRAKTAEVAQLNKEIEEIRAQLGSNQQ